MPIRVFREQEKEELKDSMLEHGFELLKEYGMTHMSVSKITEAAGIGKSTFYNFFATKEEFVYQMILKQRGEFLEQVQCVLAGRKQMTQQEAQHLIRQIVFSERSVYPYLTQEDELKLMNVQPGGAKPNLDHETDIMKHLLSYMENVKESLDYAVIANLMKVIVMASEGKVELHEEGYIRMQDKLLELLYKEIFKEDERNEG